MQEAPKPSGRASKQARGGAQHAPSRDRSAVSRRRRRAAEDAQLGVGGQDRRGLDRHPADLLARHRIRAVRRGRAATGRHSPPHRVPARGLPAALRRRTAAVTGPAAGQPAARRAGAGAGAGRAGLVLGARRRACWAVGPHQAGALPRHTSHRDVLGDPTRDGQGGPPPGGFPVQADVPHLQPAVGDRLWQTRTDTRAGRSPLIACAGGAHGGLISARWRGPAAIGRDGRSSLSLCWASRGGPEWRLECSPARPSASGCAGGLLPAAHSCVAAITAQSPTASELPWHLRYGEHAFTDDTVRRHTFEQQPPVFAISRWLRWL